MGMLLPWLRRLDANCPDKGLLQYVNDNRIGANPMSRNDFFLKEIMEGMREFAEVMGSQFELPGIGLTIEQRRRRK